MRILFVTNYYPPYEVGGYEQLCRDVAIRLEARGHEVAVLTSDRGMDQTEALDEPGVYRLLGILPQYGTRVGPAAQFFLARRSIEARDRNTYRGFANEFAPEVVFIWNLEGLPYELAVDAESQPGTAVVYWLAHYSPAQPDAYWRYWSQLPARRTWLGLPKRLLARVALAQLRREGKPVRPRMSHVAVVSEWMRRKGLAEGTLPEHTEVIYNGVETELFHRPVPQPDQKPPITLLLAGRVSPDKGVHVAIEAVAKLAHARSQRDFCLVIAGDGPADYLKELQRSVARHRITDLVCFLGRVPRERMPAIMHSSHILLLTAIYPEAFARVTLEAMAAGLAVIGTLTGGTGEILQDGVNGLTCPAQDSTALARHMGRLIDDPELRCRLAWQGQTLVLERYTLEHMVNRVEDLLRRAVLEQQRPVPPS